MNNRYSQPGRYGGGNNYGYGGTQDRGGYNSPNGYSDGFDDDFDDLNPDDGGYGNNGGQYYDDGYYDDEYYDDYDGFNFVTAGTLIICLLLAVAVLMSVILLDSYAISNTRSDASMGLMGIFHQRTESLLGQAFGEVSGYKITYSIPETTVVCPKPIPENYGSSLDDHEIASVISSSDLTVGVPMCWHSGIQYHNNTEPIWYSDPSILALTWKENNGINIINFSEIIISDGSQFRRFLCDNTFGSNNQKYATTMAESLNAVVAMNGDFYAHREAGVVVYQGKVYRDNPEFLDHCFIDRKGSMIFKRQGEISKKKDEFQQFVDDNDILFSLSFGPVLVEDHRAIDSISRYGLGEVDETYARSAIGMLGEKHYLLCLVEGKKGSFSGINVLDLAKIMEQRGCDKAYTLDGGQTAELIVNNKLYNRVVYEAERQVSDIIFFASAVNS